METVKVYLCKEKDGTFSAYVDDAAPINYGLIGEGRTAREAVAEWKDMYEAMKESYRKDGMPFNEVQFEFVYDLPSFLSYYGKIMTFRGLEHITGVSAAQLSQYASGYRNPSDKTIDKIQKGVREFTNELAAMAIN